MVDISLFFCLANAAFFAAVGIGIFAAMEERGDILGFVPAYIERKLGAGSRLYKLLTCPKCLTGQVAALCGLHSLAKLGAPYYIGTIFAAIGIAFLLSKTTQR